MQPHVLAYFAYAGIERVIHRSPRGDGREDVAHEVQEGCL